MSSRKFAKSLSHGAAPRPGCRNQVIHDGLCRIAQASALVPVKDGEPGGFAARLIKNAVFRQETAL
jgi:hypothetical protein